MTTQHPLQQRSTPARTALPLIELLVAIAIIAMRMAILLPSLKAAPRQAKQSAGLQNLKNIVASARVYESADPDGWGIPVHLLYYAQDCQDHSFVGAYEWGGKSGIGGPFVAPGAGGQYEFLKSKYRTRHEFGPATRSLSDILYSSGFTAYLNTEIGLTGRDQPGT